MTDSAKTLLDRIYNEYQDRLDQERTPEQSLIFKSEYFMQKYGYRLDELYSLLKELSDYGYVKIYHGPTGFRLLD